MRVAIVNDVRLAVEALRRVVASDPRHQVAWTALDGAEAVERCRQDRPDVVLMDLVMPVMDGAEATRRIMQESPCSVLVVTATIAGNFDLVCKALGYGAIDAVCTPVLGSAAPGQAGAELLAKLRLIERLRAPGQAASLARCLPEVEAPAACRTPTRLLPTVIVLGASTGGPPALAAILRCLPRELPAGVLVAQHIDADFLPSLVAWLQGQCALPVRVAQGGERPAAGVVLVADAASHLVVTPSRTLAYRAEVDDCPYRPSVDALFLSLASHWGAPGLAVLLTGIGRDGAEGLLRLRQAGWHTVAQDRATSVVYGMPQAASQLGAAEQVLPLEAIGPHLVAHIGAPSPRGGPGSSKP